MGHSGGSASVAIPVIEQLLRYGALTPLTDEPKEWIYHSPEVWGDKNGEGIWQNSRDSRAFSTDAGKHYYLVTDKKRFMRKKKIYKSDVFSSNDKLF